MNVKTKLRTGFRDLTGYDLHKAETWRDPYGDIRRLIKTKTPILFDVGANEGQTVKKLIEMFPMGTVHAFEPGKVFSDLSRLQHPNAKLNNFALGASPEKQQFLENSASVMSSFLPLGADGWGEIIDRREVRISTLDSYCAEHGIEAIDLLKCDTQGFDLEVLKGSDRMLISTRLIYIEVTFSKLYERMARFDQIYGFLADRGFELVSFYDLNYKNNRLEWCDALFIQDARLSCGENGL